MMSITPDAPVVSLDSASRRYPTPDGSVAGISDASLTVHAGQFVGVVGASGSGKSTLLNLVTGIDRPTSGRVSVGGRVLTDLDEDELARWRGRHIGVVFQFPQLIPTLTVAENVMLPMDFLGAVPRKDRREAAFDLLAAVGLADHRHKAPGELSGGQQQRVAVARAMANLPVLIAADEPTGNLDSHTGDMILGLLKDLTTAGTAVLIVTHERERSTVLDRVVTIADGRIARDA